MRPIKIIFYLLSAFSTVLIGIGAWQYFGPAHHPELTGSLSSTEIPNQKLLLNAYFDKNIKGASCSHEFIARDEKHLFIKLNCENSISFQSIEYDSKTFDLKNHTSTQAGSFYEKSLIRLFPKNVFDQLKLEDTRSI